MFSRPFRQAGTIALGTFTKALKVGDIVDVVVNGACQKGMPYRFYHGKTGVIFNVSRRAVGVEVNKLVRGRILRKAINVRVEHVRLSNSKKGFLDRVEKNEALKRAAKAKGETVDKSLLKRIPTQPRAGYVVKANVTGSLPVVMTPKLFDEML
jgi:large subunit ribosomal protein L21e